MPAETLKVAVSSKLQVFKSGVCRAAIAGCAVHAPLAKELIDTPLGLVRTRARLQPLQRLNAPSQSWSKLGLDDFFSSPFGRFVVARTIPEPPERDEVGAFWTNLMFPSIEELVAIMGARRLEFELDVSPTLGEQFNDAFRERPFRENEKLPWGFAIGDPRNFRAVDTAGLLVDVGLEQFADESGQRLPTFDAAFDLDAPTSIHWKGQLLGSATFSSQKSESSPSSSPGLSEIRARIQGKNIKANSASIITASVSLNQLLSFKIEELARKRSELNDPDHVAALDAEIRELESIDTYVAGLREAVVDYSNGKGAEQTVASFASDFLNGLRKWWNSPSAQGNAKTLNTVLVVSGVSLLTLCGADPTASLAVVGVIVGGNRVAEVLKKWHSSSSMPSKPKRKSRRSR